MYIPKEPLKLPPLPYSYDGLEPVTSPEALKIHYLGHHGGYVKKFNELLKNGGSRADLEFNYSGHVLHSQFWESYNPHETIPGFATLDLITAKYPGTVYPVENFVNDMVETAMKIKGSGWSLAVIRNGKLDIRSIPNHELRLVSREDPFLILDAWEHVYYLDYAHKKKEFFSGIVDLINWNTLERRALQSK